MRTAGIRKWARNTIPAGSFGLLAQLDHDQGNGAQLKRSPAQVYALVVGVALTLAGIVGFFYSSDFSTGDATRDPANREAVLGLLDVNGWHNVIHIVTGVAGLSLAGAWFGARAYAWVLGVVYLIVAAIGFAIGSGDSILGIVPVNTADNVLHIAIGGLGIIAALATPSAPPPTLAPGRLEIEHIPALDHLP